MPFEIVSNKCNTMPAHQAKLSELQKEVFLEHTLNKDTSLLNVGFRWKIDGHLNVPTLKEALSIVMHHHITLAFHVADINDELVQFAPKDIQTTVHFVDVSDLNYKQIEAKIKLIEKAPFNILNNNLYEFHVLSTSDTSHTTIAKFHHILCDAWSIQLFEQDVVKTYNSLLSGRHAPLSSGCSYNDYITDQKDYLSSQRFTKDINYWRAQLSEAEDNLFPTKGNGIVKALPNRRSTLTLSWDSNGDLSNWCQASGTTLFQYLVAVMLHQARRLFDKETLIIGIPVLNRKSKYKKSQGLFANVLPVAFQCPTTASFEELLKNTKKTLRAAFRHQQAPFGEIIRNWHAQGNLGLPYDIKLSYEFYNSEDSFTGTNTQRVHLRQHYQNNPLSIYIRHWELLGEIEVDFDYWPEAFQPMGGITSFQHLFSHLLSSLWRETAQSNPGCIDHHELLLTQPDPLSPAIATGYPDNLVTIFEQQVQSNPDRVALSYQDKTLTYAELNDRANNIAIHLINLGVMPEEVVGIQSYRSFELVIGLLGILKAGCAYLPLDPSNPASRLNYITENANCRFILLGNDVSSSPDSGKALDIAAIASLVKGVANPNLPIRSNQLAYVLYTSGSTGNPKGVMLEHGGVVNRIAWQQTRWPIGVDDCLIQKTPYSFDVSVWELFWWSFTGAKLHLSENGAERDPGQLLEAISKQNVSAIHFVPSMLGAFLDHLEASQHETEKLASLKYVICSGEELTKSHVSRFYKLTQVHGLSAQLINLYGPTEASIDVSYYHCMSMDIDKYDSIPIGKAAENVYLQVRNALGQILPYGFPGELYIGGCQLARGYRNNTELTNNVFIDNTFESINTHKWYKTGDRVRQLPDGNIEFLGRIDHQIKIRGNRVELGEIETKLRSYKSITESVVLLAPEQESPLLCAYYVAPSPIDSESLNEYLQCSLPTYMIPQVYVHLTHFPLTPNGKLDRKALPNVELIKKDTEAYLAAATPIEKHLVDAFEAVLNVTRIGTNSSFFSLGGDSLKILKIKARLKQKGYDFDIVKIFENPTIKSLAPAVFSYHASLDSAHQITPYALLEDTLDKKYVNSFEDIFPATELQLGMIYHSMKNPDSTVYHDIFHYTFESKWNQSAWQAACELIVERHESLRLSFDLARATRPLQRVHSTISLPLKTFDCEGFSHDHIALCVGEYIAERQDHQYQWHQAPLFEIGTFITEGKIELIFSFHHSILDGWSVATIVSELMHSYHDKLNNQSSSLAPTPKTRFVDYVALEQDACKDKAQRKFWRSYLDDISFSAFQNWTSYLEPPDSYQHKQHYTQFSPQTQQKLEEFCHQNQFPIKHVLLAMHCLTEQLMNGQDNITTGIISNGRPDTIDSDRVTGIFLNTVPMRFNNMNITWRDAIDQVTAEITKIYPYRRFPMAEIQQECGDHKLFDVVFNFVDFDVLKNAIALPDIRLTQWQPMEVTNFSLLANFGRNPINNQLFFKLDYDTHKVSEEQIRLYVRYGSAILDAIISNPDESIDYQIILAAKRPKSSIADADLAALEQKPNASSPEPIKSFIEQFSISARSHPDSPSLITEDNVVTYKELENETNQWSRYLRQQGVKQGDRVCLYLPRSINLVKAIVAILKAGATYVPLDQNYPLDRLAIIVEDSKPHLMFTDRLGLSVVRMLSETIPTLCWEDHSEAVQHQPSDMLDLDINPLANAYILFTSGSTGRPKGVAMPYRALDNLIQWQLNDMPLAQGTRSLQYSPIGFDVSFQEIFSTLCGGGELVLIPEALRTDLLSLTKFLDQFSIERLFMPFIALQHLAEIAIETNNVPSYLKTIVTAGEQLKITPQIREFASALKDCRLDNHYGPTETHVVTRHTLTLPACAWPTLPPIGSSISNTNVLVVDSQNRISPTGIVGEIVIAGQCLANGYFQQDALTGERFVTLNINDSSVRYYRTGDTGFLLPDGNIVCLGRIDTQVKVRGYRVELGEIELKLMQFNNTTDCIRSASVIAKRDKSGNTYLVAFLEVNKQALPELSEIKDHLHRCLPDYMVPKHLEVIPEMPLTPSGKVNTRALGDRPISPRIEHLIQAPKTETEAALLSIWKEVLSLDKVCVTDNFFDLGGHSLVAIRMVALIEKRLSTTTPLATFVESPSIRTFAAKLDQLANSKSNFDSYVDFSSAPSSTPIFLIHPIGGNIICYSGLANSFKGRLNLVALQAPGTTGALEPINGIRELARYYAAIISERYPKGPLHLGGWSFGGFVAFELKQEFARRGRQVDNLFLLDSIMLRKRSGVDVTESQLLNWFMWELLAGDWQQGHAVNEIAFTNVSIEAAYKIILQQAIDKNLLPDSSSPLQIERLFRVFRANWQALLNYTPSHSDQPITLFSASSSLPQVLLDPHRVVDSAHDDPQNGWGKFCSNINLIKVPGDHLTMMTTPNINTIGSAIFNQITSTTHLEDKHNESAIG